MIVTSPVRAARIVHLWKTATPANVSPNKRKSTGIPNTEGHFMQGHVDFVSSIIGLKRKGTDFRLEVGLPESFAHYVASKGSIAVNGISLTVADVLPKSFVAWIIPYTKRHTNLDRATAGDL